MAGGVSMPAEKYFTLVETAVFGFQRDPAVRTGMLSLNNAASCCNSGQIAIEIELIRACLLEDHPGKAKEAANTEREDEENIATAASMLDLGISELRV